MSSMISEQTMAGAQASAKAKITNWNNVPLEKNKANKEPIVRHDSEEAARKPTTREAAFLVAHPCIREPVKPRPIPNPEPQAARGKTFKAPNRRRCVVDSDDEKPISATPARIPGRASKQAMSKQRHQHSMPTAQRHSALPSAAALGHTHQVRGAIANKTEISRWSDIQQELIQQARPRQGDKWFTDDRRTCARNLARRKKPMSQPRPRKRRPQESMFLSRLPGEIRNKIYAYVVDEPRVLICATKPQDEIVEMQKLWENEGKCIRKPRSRLYPVLDILQYDRGMQIHASASLLFVNKQIKDEAEYHLYSNTNFCFLNLKVLGRFLKEASPSGIRVIRSIELEMQCYGEPKQRELQRFKRRSDVRWQFTCEQVSAQMSQLRSVKIHARLSEWPLSDIRCTKWHKSLMTMVSKQQLFNAEVNITHPRFRDRKLNEMAAKVEADMMSEKGLEERERLINLECMRRVEAAVAAENERRAKLPLQTNKILRIVIEKPKTVDPSIDTQLAAYQASHQQITATKVPGKRPNRYNTTGKKWRCKYGAGYSTGALTY